MREITSAYVSVPATGRGPGVLVLHSWWGLTRGIKQICDRLADAGFVALAPDLFNGEVAADEAEGQELLHSLDPNELVRDVRAAAATLADIPATEGSTLGVVGMSMGASMALWLAERSPGAVAAAVAFYGTQDIDFTRATAAFQCHFAGQDSFVGDDGAAFLEAVLHLGATDRLVVVHHYPTAHHWFFEPGTPGFDQADAEQAWDRVLPFLRDTLAG